MRLVFRTLTFLPLAAAVLAMLACASFPNLTIPSLSTATARAALTATVEAGGDYHTSSGLVIGSLDTTEKAVDAQAPFLESLAQEQYAAADLSQAGQTYTYTIDIDKEQTLIWQTNWCTTTEEILNQNMEHIRLEFTVNGESVDPGHIGIVQTRSDDLYCAYFLASLSEWPQGTTVLKIDMTFTDVINDGMADYPKGTHTYQYTVTLK
jgi:hypothetical protein